jgi:hypothetical protein
MQQAYLNQQEVRSYQFTGDAQLNLDFAPLDDAPLTESLLALVRKSELQWTGVSSLDPVQLELKLTIKPEGSPVALPMPMIIKDNKMYLQFPVITQMDEYIRIELDQSSTGINSGPALNTELLIHSGQAFSTLYDLLTTDLNPKWFKKDGERLILDITEDNRIEISENWSAKSTQIAQLLLGNSTTETGADSFNNIVIEGPGEWSITVNDDGMIHNQKIHLNLTITDVMGRNATHQIKTEINYTQINKPPVFTLPLPQKIKPLEDILSKLIGSP